METDTIIKIAANALNSKKAKELKCIKVDELTSFADYFLIATANSSTQVRAFCDEVEDKLREEGLPPHHIEGRATGWLVLDYNTVIVHIFTPDQREFYGLDNMWKDGTEIDLSEILDEAEGD